MPNPFQRRLTSRDIPGYAGGTLEDLLDQQAQESWHPPMAAPADGSKAPVVPSPRPAVQQPVEVVDQAPPAEDIGAPPPWTRPTYDPQTGKPKRGTSSDPVENSSEYYNALERWEPRGAKRGFKNSMKAGLMYASDEIRAHPEDPVTAAIAGFGVGAGGATAAPNFKNRLTREWNLNKTGGELQNQLKLQGEQAKIGSLQNKPRMQQAAQDEREINNALSQYNRLESFDPDDPADIGLKQYFEGRGLKLPKKIKGSNVIANWSNGRLTLTDKTNAESRDTTVTDAGRTPNAAGLNPNQQSVNDRDAASRESRESQWALAEKGRNARANARNQQSERNATIVSGGQVARMGDPTVHQTNIAEIDKDIDDLDGQIKTLTAKRQAGGLTSSEGEALNASQREKKGLERERRDEREKLGKIESAQNPPAQRKAGKIGPGEDAAVRAYANEFFGGNYQKAFAARQAQRQKK